MDVALAREYHKSLATMLSQLQLARTPQERAPIVQRMHNLVEPLYTVHSGAAQHMDEALRKLKYAQQPIVNAALHTVQHALQQIHHRIHAYEETHFVHHGPLRLFVRPVVADELRSIVEKNRLFDELHSRYVHAFAAPPAVEEALLEMHPSLLRPALQRLGFTESDALLFFQTTALPRVAHPVERIPSLTLCKFPSGIHISAVKHRVF